MKRVGYLHPLESKLFDTEQVVQSNKQQEAHGVQHFHDFDGDGNAVAKLVGGDQIAKEKDGKPADIKRDCSDIHFFKGVLNGINSILEHKSIL
jgi:hypothetical protein